MLLKALMNTTTANTAMTPVSSVSASDNADALFVMTPASFNDGEAASDVAVESQPLRMVHVLKYTHDLYHGITRRVVSLVPQGTVVSASASTSSRGARTLARRRVHHHNNSSACDVSGSSSSGLFFTPSSNEASHCGQENEDDDSHVDEIEHNFFTSNMMSNNNNRNHIAATASATSAPAAVLMQPSSAAMWVSQPWELIACPVRFLPAMEMIKQQIAFYGSHTWGAEFGYIFAMFTDLVERCMQTPVMAQHHLMGYYAFRQMQFRQMQQQQQQQAAMTMMMMSPIVEQEEVDAIAEATEETPIAPVADEDSDVQPMLPHHGGRACDTPQLQSLAPMASRHHNGDVDHEEERQYFANTSSSSSSNININHNRAASSTPAPRPLELPLSMLHRQQDDETSVTPRAAQTSSSSSSSLGKQNHAGGAATCGTNTPAQRSASRGSTNSATTTPPSRPANPTDSSSSDSAAMAAIQADIARWNETRRTMMALHNQQQQQQLEQRHAANNNFASSNVTSEQSTPRAAVIVTPQTRALYMRNASDDKDVFEASTTSSNGYHGFATPPSMTPPLSALSPMRGESNGNNGGAFALSVLDEQLREAERRFQQHKREMTGVAVTVTTTAPLPTPMSRRSSNRRASNNNDAHNMSGASFNSSNSNDASNNNSNDGDDNNIIIGINRRNSPSPNNSNSQQPSASTTPSRRQQQVVSPGAASTHSSVATTAAVAAVNTLNIAELSRQHSTHRLHQFGSMHRHNSSSHHHNSSGALFSDNNSFATASGAVTPSCSPRSPAGGYCNPMASGHPFSFFGATTTSSSCGGGDCGGDSLSTTPQRPLSRANSLQSAATASRQNTMTSFLCASNSGNNANDALSASAPSMTPESPFCARSSSNSSNQHGSSTIVSATIAAASNKHGAFPSIPEDSAILSANHTTSASQSATPQQHNLLVSPGSSSLPSGRATPSLSNAATAAAPSRCGSGLSESCRRPSFNVANTCNAHFSSSVRRYSGSGNYSGSASAASGGSSSTTHRREQTRPYFTGAARLVDGASHWRQHDGCLSLSSPPGASNAFRLAPGARLARVQFRGRCGVYTVPASLSDRVKFGDYVTVMGDRGIDLGQIICFDDDALAVLKQTSSWYDPNVLVLDLATQEQIATYRTVRQSEADEVIAMLRQMQDVFRSQAIVDPETNELIDGGELFKSGMGTRVDMMEFVNAEFQFDKQKLTIYFRAQNNVAFVKLAQTLHQRFRCRIWLHDLMRTPTSVHVQQPSPPQSPPEAPLLLPE